jgi:hypothetical protein
MAVLSQSVAVLREPGGAITVDITLDSITLLVLSVTVANNSGHSYTFTVTNTVNPLQTFTRTLGAGTTALDLTALGLPWPINPDASMADGWVFNG